MKKYFIFFISILILLSSNNLNSQSKKGNEVEDLKAKVSNLQNEIRVLTDKVNSMQTTINKITKNQDDIVQYFQSISAKINSTKQAYVIILKNVKKNDFDIIKQIVNQYEIELFEYTFHEDYREGGIHRMEYVIDGEIGLFESYEEAVEFKVHFPKGYFYEVINKKP